LLYLVSQITMPSTSPSFHPLFTADLMGVGTWSWGDRLFWGFGREYSEADVRASFQASLDAGMHFFDTAELYGQGKSECLLGQFLKTCQQPVVIATKFMPLPWRLNKASLARALKNSLQRLGRETVNLYQIHWPFPPVTIESWMEALAQAAQDGYAQAVGVSNYSCTQTERAYTALARFGIPLASNQVEYHLLNRSIEKNGLFALCNELGIKIIAYSPLAQGLLTGKYTPEEPPHGARDGHVDRNYLKRIQPLIQVLRKIGNAHEGRTPSQVALNWTICKGAFPIPGAKNGRQALQNAGALGWRLCEDEVAELDRTSDWVTQPTDKG
jgi:aryl-alcohol dehydrogenase-like predicted oxidoreductase